MIHSGDFSSRGFQFEVEPFGEWLRSLNQFQYKCVISGNHDRSLEDTPVQAREWLYGHAEPGLCGVHYLQDSEITLNIRGQDVRIYGSPWQPAFCNWAFNLTQEQLKEKWKLIPENLSVLVTHGPPYRILDKTSYDQRHVGCRELKMAVQRAKPLLHVFGHIHEGYGVSEWNGTVFANAASCTSKYQPTNRALVFDLGDDGVMRQVKDESVPQTPAL